MPFFLATHMVILFIKYKTSTTQYSNIKFQFNSFLVKVRFKVLVDPIL